MFLELKEFQYFVWLPACYAYILSMVPRWYIFIPKDQILEYFWNLRMETVSWHFYSHLVFFIAIWYILWVIWYILLPFWYCEPRKIWQPCFGVPKRGTTETVLEKTGCCTYASIIFKLKLNRFIFRGIFEIARTKSICTFIHLCIQMTSKQCLAKRKRIGAPLKCRLSKCRLALMSKNDHPILTSPAVISKHFYVEN
jgi:hypothetical protein